MNSYQSRTINLSICYEQEGIVSFYFQKKRKEKVTSLFFSLSHTLKLNINEFLPIKSCVILWNYVREQWSKYLERRWKYLKIKLVSCQEVIYGSDLLTCTINGKIPREEEKSSYGFHQSRESLRPGIDRF